MMLKEILSMTENKIFDRKSIKIVSEHHKNEFMLESVIMNSSGKSKNLAIDKENLAISNRNLLFGQLKRQLSVCKIRLTTRETS